MTDRAASNLSHDPQALEGNWSMLKPIALTVAVLLFAGVADAEQITGWRRESVMLRSGPGEAGEAVPRTALPVPVEIVARQPGLLGFRDAQGKLRYVRDTDVTTSEGGAAPAAPGYTPPTRAEATGRGSMGLGR
jgi:hypothetical protein